MYVYYYVYIYIYICSHALSLSSNLAQGSQGVRDLLEGLKGNANLQWLTMNMIEPILTMSVTCSDCLLKICLPDAYLPNHIYLLACLPMLACLYLFVLIPLSISLLQTCCQKDLTMFCFQLVRYGEKREDSERASLWTCLCQLLLHSPPQMLVNRVNFASLGCAWTDFLEPPLENTHCGTYSISLQDIDKDAKELLGCHVMVCHMSADTQPSKRIWCSKDSFPIKNRMLRLHWNPNVSRETRIMKAVEDDNAPHVVFIIPWDLSCKPSRRLLVCLPCCKSMWTTLSDSPPGTSIP